MRTFRRIQLVPVDAANTAKIQQLPAKCKLHTGATFMIDSKHCAPGTQEQAKVQSAEAEACRLAAHDGQQRFQQGNPQ